MLEEKTGFDWAPDQDPFFQSGISNLPTDAPLLHQMGDFASMGLGLGYWPSSLFINLLEFVHVSTLLPWWTCMALVVLMVRVVLFPILLPTYRNAAIAGYHRDEMLKQKEKLKEVAKRRNAFEMAELQNKQFAMYRTWGYKPFIGFIAFLQMPVFYGMFRMCTKCSLLPVPGWDVGGTLWFTDLTVPDPFYILPVVSGLTTAVTIFVCSLWGGVV
jgi:YidC/Oxa1 family membrane protein insertase